MSLRFIGTVVAAALAITVAGKTPASADEDLARALFAVVGLAVAGKLINDRLEAQEAKEKKKKKSRVTRANNRLDETHWRDWDEWDPAIRRLEPRPLPKSVRKKLLPGDCLRSFDTSSGRKVVFGRKCLQDNFAYSDSLPDDCAVKFRALNKKRRGYDARCLRREGYQLARN